jgi:hypothetical protein
LAPHLAVMTPFAMNGRTISDKTSASERLGIVF